MKVLQIDNSNSEPKMVFGDAPDPEPDDFSLLVKIEATALNRADLHQKEGKYPPPKGASPLLGLEMAGTVLSTGRGVTRFEPGDHLFGLLSGGGYTEKCVIHERMAMHMPSNYSFEEAAAIPESFLTAFQALKMLGNIRKHETVLIHAGASGVGSAAIQLARHLFKARIITTVGKKKKVSFCKKIGADLSVNYKKEAFQEVIETAYGTRPVDIVIDFIGAPYWNQNLDLLAMDGRLVNLSLLGGSKISNGSLAPILLKRLSVIGSTLRNRSDDYKMRLTSDFHSYTMDLFESDTVRPVIDRIYPWEEVEKAHKRMANNRNMGKIVLTGM